MIVSTKELATILGVTDRRVRQLGNEGVIVPAEGKGRWELPASVQGYLDSKSIRSDSAERIRQMKAREMEIKLAVQDRKIIALDEAMGFIEELCGVFNTALGSLPARITTRANERERISDIIRDTQEQISKKFEALSGELGDPA